jgi:hypothetical protein
MNGTLIRPAAFVAIELELVGVPVVTVPLGAKVVVIDSDAVVGLGSSVVPGPSVGLGPSEAQPFFVTMA